MLTVFEVIDEKRTHRGGEKKKMRELFFLVLFVCSFVQQRKTIRESEKEGEIHQGVGGGGERMMRKET